MPASGGEPERLATFRPLDSLAPRILPGGGQVLLALGDLTPSVAVVPLDSGAPTILIEGTQPHSVSTGHLVFARDNALFAAPFDPRTAEMTGAPTRVLENIDQVNSAFGYSFALSEEGTLIYIGGHVASRMVWVSRSGDEEELQDVETSYHSVKLSPDGARVVVDELITGSIWVHDLARGTRTLVLRQPDASDASWNPNGQHIAFLTETGLHEKATDGTGDPRPIFARATRMSTISYTPDGRVLAFTERGTDTGHDLWTVRLGEEPVPFSVTSAFEHAPAFSPDGRWLAFVSDQNGR